MKTPSVLRIVRLPAAESTVASSASGPRGAERFKAEATFAGAHLAENGDRQDLRVTFETDAEGRIGTPVLSVASGASVDTTGPCAPICVRSPDGKHQRCFYPCGGGSSFVLGAPSMVLEFASEATDSLKLDVKLWQQGDDSPTDLSTGEVDLPAAGSVDE